MNQLSISKYFKRIGFTNEAIPDFETLRELHRKHLYSIPFENLDIQYGNNIKLNIGSIQKKILDHNRGGFCYELNGLFYELLKAIGFKVKMVSARVRRDDGSFGPEFDHLVLIVELDKLWLVDVGFGDNFIEPKEVKLNMEQTDLAGVFKIMQHTNEHLKLMRSQNLEPFGEEYIFSMTERKFSDFADMCKYHQTSPQSTFTKGKLCSIANRKGRITINDEKLIITRNGKRSELELNDENDFFEKLDEHFGITIKQLRFE